METFDQLKTAIGGAPRCQIDELVKLVWRSFGAAALTETEAQALVDHAEARRALPVGLTKPAVVPARRQGARPRSPDALLRRRRVANTGRLPPALAARFTVGELAALSMIAWLCQQHGRCGLCLDAIANMAGVGRTTVQNAIRLAAAAGLLNVQVRKLHAWRNRTNLISIASAEWSSWLAKRPRGGGFKNSDGSEYRSEKELQRSLVLAEPRGLREGFEPPPGRKRSGPEGPAKCEAV